MTAPIKGCILTSLLFLLGFTGKGQSEPIRFYHIGIEEGLFNESITTMLQDRKGFMWFGTFDGLYRYDAYSFRKFQFDPLDSNSLSANFIYTIFEDSSGIIWASTFDGLCKFDWSTEKFIRYKPTLPGFSNPNICAINQDRYGILWLGNTSGELCRFDPKESKFIESIKLPNPQSNRGAVNNIYRDPGGKLWLGSGVGLYEISWGNEKGNQAGAFKIIPHFSDPSDPNSLSNNFVGTIIKDKRGIYWIATRNGLNSYDKNTGTFKKFQHDRGKSNSGNSDNLTIWFGNGIKEDKEGNLWFSTKNGLSMLNEARTTITTYLHDAQDPYSISSNIIQCLYIDREGLIWAGSFNAKLNKANLQKNGFGFRKNIPSNPNSLSSNEISSIMEDSSGIVWIGTKEDGLNRWDKTTDQISRFKADSSDPTSLKNNSVSALFKDSHGHLWVGNGDVLSQLNNKTGKFIHFNINPAVNPKGFSRKVFAITEDKQGLLWLGSSDNGIRSFNQKTGEVKAWYYDPKNTEGLSDFGVQAIFADSKNNIWVGHGSMGTDKYVQQSQQFEHYKHNSADSTSIGSNIVFDFLEDSKGYVWLGTWAGGLCRFDHATGKFRIYTEKDGLPSNTVFSILEDNDHFLWLGTRNGLSRFNPASGTFTNYDFKDGLQGNVFATSLGKELGPKFKGKDGTLYFGGSNGFNFFGPAGLTRNSVLSPVVITQFKVFDEALKGISDLKKIVLKFKQNYFSFEFSSLSYSNPAKILYKYKLEGVDNDWIESGSRRYVSYTNVSPGTYTFRVMGTNSDGVWNENGTSILIVISPPWWRTWWAYTFYVAMSIFTITIFIQYQRRRAAMKEREKAREKELKQAREIEKAYTDLKLTQAQLIQSEKMASLGELTAGIAHEIQNPLNFVNNFSEVSKDLLEEMKTELDSGNAPDAKALANDVIKNLEKIHNHGKRADAIVKGMLQHSRSSTGKKDPTDINALVDEYLRLSYHGTRAKDSSFLAITQTNIDQSIQMINIVPQDIGRVLLNIFSNAFYAVSAKASTSAMASEDKLAKASSIYEPTVSVTTKKIGNNVEIRIRDNGNGIPQNVVGKIFQPFFTTKPTGQGTGLGLSLSYDIIKAHGGEIAVDTKEGKGTEFIIKLPII